MGVKGLWPILEPALQSVNLPDLRNLRLAVDLSIWICEGMTAFSQVKGKAALTKKRLIFQRIMRMLQWGIRPVFVFDGQPPDLKAATLERRGHSVVPPHPPGTYTRLTDELKEMFNALNVPYVVSDGEAEALCAQLNAAGLVDGCITNDSDAFLFGAEVVYRNFTADAHKVAMQRCSMKDIEKKLGITRDRMVALGLLSGCDYTKGVEGIGTETVQGFFKEVGPDDDIFRRLQHWKDDHELERISAFKSLHKPSHCSRCCHFGLKRAHDKDGCGLCKTNGSCYEKNLPCTCEYHQNMKLYKSRVSEISIRSKALAVEGFPNMKIVNAFLHPAVNVPKENFEWIPPNIEELKKYVRRKFNWSVEETLDNVLSLYTGLDMVRSSNAQVPCKSVPIKILKKRQKHFSTVFEVQWRFVDNVHDDIEHLVTYEDANLFNECFPEVVCSYDLMAEKKRAKLKGKRKPDDSQTKINQIFKVRKKLFVTPSNPSKGSALNGDVGDGSSSQMDFDSLATALPQTPPRRSPRATPKKRKAYSPSPSRLSQGPVDFAARGIVPKRLCYPESTPDRSKGLQTPMKKREETTTSNGMSSEQEMVVDTAAANTTTPINQDIFNRKDTFLPTLSPMRRFVDGEAESSSAAKRESAFNEDYRKVKESMTMFDLNNPKPSTSVFSATKAKTPSVSSAVKSARKSGSKSTSKKLKTPGSGQMRINEFVKRRLLR